MNKLQQTKAELLKNIPSELQDRVQWVLWDKKKHPLRPNGQLASTTDPTTWSTLETCLNALNTSKRFQGIGFVFTDADPYVGIDLDECFPLSDSLQALLEEFNACYAEVSQSGKGLHLIIKAKKTLSCCHYSGSPLSCKKVEIYDNKRFFALTGNIFNGQRSPGEQQQPLNILIEILDQQPQSEPKVTRKHAPKLPQASEHILQYAVLRTLQEYGQGMFDDYQNDVSRQDFLRLGFACKAGNVPFEEFDAIVSQSGGYDHEENRKLYETLKPNTITFATAFYYARKANPERLQELIRENITYVENLEQQSAPEHQTRITLHPGQTVSDIDFTHILNHFSDVALYADTGTGKTYFCLNALPRLFPDKYILIFEPTTILAEQKANDTVDPDMTINVIKAGNKPTNDPVQTSTYNGIEKIPERILDNAIAVIDEAHQMTLCMGYRKRVIHRLKAMIARCEKRIYISATPLTFAQNYTVEHEIYITRSQAPVNAIDIATKDKRKSLEILHTPGNTTLVYVYGRDKAEEIAAYFEKKGYRTGFIHSKTKWKTLHKNLIDIGEIDHSLDFLFVSSYPSEGVDFKDHNITKIVFYDFAPPALVRQLASRSRTTPIEKIYFLLSNTTHAPGLPFTQETEAYFRQLFSDVAHAQAKLFNAQRQRNRYDKTCQRAQALLDTDPAKCVLENHEGVFQVDHDAINYLVYREYEKVCRYDRTFFHKELERYNINHKTTLQHNQQRTPGENETLKEVNEKLTHQRHEQFLQELQRATLLEDEELFQQHEEETEAKIKLRLLTKETGNRTLATKILYEIGNSSAKFREVFGQAKIQKYQQQKHKTQALENIAKIGTVGDRLNGEEIFSQIADIYEQAPRYKTQYQNLKRTDYELTQAKAIRHARFFVDLKRTKRSDGQGGYENVYEITSLNPLAKYEPVELPQDYVLSLRENPEVSHFSSSEKIQISAKSEKPQPLDISEHIIDSYSDPEYARDQIRIFGKVF